MATKLSTLINALGGKGTPVDADKIPALDSTASNIFNFVTWANVKTTLKSYFDPLYLSTATTLAVTHGGTGLATVAASSVLVATTTDTINAVTLSSGTVLGQRATGTIVPISYANLKSDLAINVGSDTSGSLSIVSATSGTLTIGKGGTGLTTVAASSVLVATATDTITAVTLGAGTVFGQRATGNIAAISYANLKTDLSLDAVANVDQLPRSEAPVIITTSTTLTSATHGGKTLMCNNTAAITLSITSGTATQNMQCQAVSVNTASVTIVSLGGDLINLNSATAPIITAQFKSAYIYKYASNSVWVDY